MTYDWRKAPLKLSHFGHAKATKWEREHGYPISFFDLMEHLDSVNHLKHQKDCLALLDYKSKD